MDEEIRMACVRYGGQDFDKPRIIQVSALSTCYDEDWTLDEFRAILDSVPEEYADSARVEFEYGRGEDSSFLKVWYLRQETDEEVLARVMRCVDFVAEAQAQEAAEYARLKTKFGNA